MDIEKIREEFYNDFGDLKGFSKSIMWNWIKTRLTEAASEVNVDSQVSPKIVDFGHSDLPKEERNRIILLAIDNTINPKRKITFEQADWLRFISVLRKEGWKIVKC